jgi:hypothetical protein
LSYFTFIVNEQYTGAVSGKRFCFIPCFQDKNKTDQKRIIT